MGRTFMTFDCVCCFLFFSFASFLCALMFLVCVELEFEG